MTQYTINTRTDFRFETLKFDLHGERSPEIKAAL